ncbi:hypothetical protein COY07_00195 [Candidatus Peregrinibacteria bacterium CG_4_10_14_0_2_um_filter_43_11]|nr:MAG: hypothetical protein COY07_00195 [Candidatus Peregrinibacteria bacterium CG_4_10_14_0_2_um_filter_43_11]
MLFDIDVDEHPNMTLPQRYNWLSDFVYGGIDGSVTTFAVIAGVQGAALPISIILILGFANLFADGFSMATGKYLSDKALLEEFEKIRQIEFKHLETKFHHERGEVEDILRGYGIHGEILDQATDQIIANPEGWVDIMMRNEFNMTHENINPLKGAFATFTAFLAIGFIPLAGYTFQSFFSVSQDMIFLITCFTTAIALFIVGTIKSLFVMKRWFAAGFETVFFGGIAASIAYSVGFLLRGMVA